MVAASVGIGLFQAAQTFAADDFSVPGTFDQEFAEGEWVIFERTDEAVDGGLIDTTARQVTTIEVFDSTGVPIAVQLMDGTFIQSAEINGAIYEGVATFDVTTPGTFSIDVEASGPTEVRVGKSLTQNIALFFVVVVLGLGGIMTGIAGIVVAAIAWTRRTPTTSTVTA